ncbi:uncharacterized protein F4822DRAFT_47352 [Hypoxylon trugodes]|uniref:uncharacterized protein n=1 Tax=Hypoxylon trugodes TaxID=326681 RepID=UPI0021938453|nr:uncharacterized protein F4822DRAFT_47352 [Hypoxylon trugodes]KAI1394423.1 hypothetical protein F4822DRAFT_47352 [Hypoxylon trugodes]
MAEKDMRLRLVVRREGLADERLMWNISLKDDPTISKLLQDVNETITLEIGQTGLENYVVELHDADGMSFECLHFQPLRTILKPDDRVFIRALNRDDNRRRRISGRYQISSDGRHLIDGVAFGRRPLVPSGGRYPISLPPRKRPKLTNDDPENEQDTPMLYLTNGEELDPRKDSSNVRFDTDLEDEDVGDENFGSDAQVDGSSESEDEEEENSESSDEDDLDEELQGLMEDAASLQDGPEPGKAPDANQLDPGEGNQSVYALRSAFPLAPVDICEKILENSDGDLKAAYGNLIEGFEPKMSISAMLKCASSDRQVSKSTTQETSAKGISNKDDMMEDDENLSDVSDGESEEEVSTFVREFDHRGLPPGSITSGKGLAQMAAISGSFTNSKFGVESETTSTTLNGSKASPEKTIDGDSGTSSDAPSSSSEDEDFEVGSEEDDSDDDASSESSDNSDDENSDNNNDDNDNGNRDARAGDQPGSHSDASDSSENSDSQSDDSSEDSDSGPEETSAKSNMRGNTSQIGGKKALDHESSDMDTSSSDISSDSDASSSSSEESSDDDSSEAESTPGSGSTHFQKKPLPAANTRQSQVSLTATSHLKPVPPGAGKDSTKRRNARRRAANRAKKLEMQDANTTYTVTASDEAQPSAPTPTVLDEKALFEAKRQELLDAIANGGVEVGPSRPSTTTKRKRNESNELAQQDSLEHTPTETSMGEDTQSPASDQKRRRVDVGAGRRLLFGALGLRNPKSKEDEDDLRAKLMKDVRPLQNVRLEQDKSNQKEVSGMLEEEDDAWKEKIIYRAVECCQEGVVLSEPPFPFVQRWDPQQQSSWFQKKNKRGGQSKRAQRNEAHFYQDNRSNKKRRHDESAMWDEEGYDDTFNGINDDTNADVELNYDDPVDGQQYGTNEPTNDASQFTDMDDLPSLPSDLSTLPILRPGEVQVGMVITWQQWSCSSATNWQPQLSNVAGVVVRIDDDATGLEVCLAKRDRNLDRNEKKYDQNTGQRIYDKFEAPDLDDDDDEDEGEDEGFRTIGFAEMQQPRILQQPLLAMVDTEKSNENPQTETKLSIETDDTRVGVNTELSNTTNLAKEDTSNVTSSDASQLEQGARIDISTSDSSRISSPSRQLHENASQATNTNPQDHPTKEITSRGETDSGTTMKKPNTDVSSLGFPSVEQSSGPLFDSYEDEVVAGTPKVVKSKVFVPPSSASSTRSRRQPDHTLDMDIAEPESLKVTEDGCSVAPDMEDRLASDGDERMSTPTPKPARQSTPAADQGEVTTNRQISSPANPSTPSSLASLNTVWCTALTSRNTQSPCKSQSQPQSVAAKASQQAQARKDREYEEAMRRLDDLPNDQDSVSRVPDSFEPSSILRDPDGVVDDDHTNRRSSKSPQIKVSPSPVKKRSSLKSASQFTLPPGTQVVELSSDSEPVYTEDYADEEVDGNYSPEADGFPTGNGWVKKDLGVKARNVRSVTAPQAIKKKPLLSSRGRHSTSPSSSTPNFGPIKARRKTSSRF